MKIIELRAENVKRLKAIDITPDSTLQVIGGKNAQGKSSVLDAIWLALGGGKASKETPRPIREGESQASIRLDLGNLVVTRTWTEKGTTLTVESADGARFTSPQALLDSLVGQLTFDPLAFTRLDSKKQREALLDLVDLDVDLDDLDAQAKEIYAQRTEVGRQAKAIGDVTVDDTLPTEERSAMDYVTQIQEAQGHNAALTHAEGDLERSVREVERLEAEIATLQKALEAAKEEVHQTSLFLNDTPSIDLAPLEAALENIEVTNAQIRANNVARQKAANKARLQEQYDGLTDRLAQLDGQKRAALAGASFPIPGLSFDDSGVLYEGVPLSQASSAQQIQVSLAMGMALNPRLRVLMIKDGSLLDKDSLAAIHQHVAEEDFQLWLEVVDPSDPTAVIISDGQVQA